MSELLCIDIKTLYDGEFQFYQTGLIHKVLEATLMDHCNFFPTPTKVEAPLGTDANSSEAKRYFPSSYASIILMMLDGHQKQYQIFTLLFTSVPGLNITPRYHMIRL